MNIVQRNISELIPAEYNPRYISDEQLEHLKASIQRFDAVEPVLVNMHPDRKNIIVSGHQRLKAAKALGMKKFPCVELNLDKDKERELNVRMNKNTGGWDWDSLSTYFDTEELTEWGFTDEELFGNIVEEEAEAEEDDYEIPEEIHTDFVLGDLIEIGEHRLLCGDSTDSDQVAKLMGGEKADMVFTDPPYALFGNSTGVEGVTDDNMVRPFFKAIMKLFKCNTKNYGHIYMCCDWHSAFSIESCARDVELKAKNMCIWDKGDGGVGAMYQQCYEIVWFFDNSPTNKTTMRTVKAGVRTVNGVPNIWRVPRVSGQRSHNAQKPVDMIKIPLTNGSDPSELVLDLFVGSGSTMVACHQLNRKCYGMELDPKYCQVIVDRMLKLDSSLEIKVNGKKYLKTG